MSPLTLCVRVGFANAGEARADEKLNCLLLILLGDNKLITALIPSLCRDVVV
jgi:hypothetical protein